MGDIASQIMPLAKQIAVTGAKPITAAQGAIETIAPMKGLCRGWIRFPHPPLQRESSPRRGLFALQRRRLPHWPCTFGGNHLGLDKESGMRSTMRSTYQILGPDPRFG